MKKNISKIREREGVKKSTPIIWELESEAFILGNGREREFPLTAQSGTLWYFFPDSAQTKLASVLTSAPKQIMSKWIGCFFKWGLLTLKKVLCLVLFE